MEKGNILFVDDDVMLRQIITLALQEAGYHVCYQTSTTAIMHVISELKPAIILLDVEIGQDNGIDLAGKIKAFSPEIPILFLSSHTDDTNVVRALEAGGVSYLKKPVSIPELLAYIRRFTKSSQPIDIAVGTFMFHVRDNTLRKGGTLIAKLTPLEGKLLRILAVNLNSVVTREQLEKYLWEVSYDHQASLNNLVSSLRKHLTADKNLELKTVSHVGYLLSSQ